MNYNMNQDSELSRFIVNGPDTVAVPESLVHVGRQFQQIMMMDTLSLIHILLYGQAFMVLLPARVVKNLVMWPLDSLIFYTIAKTMETAGIFRAIRGRAVS